MNFYPVFRSYHHNGGIELRYPSTDCLPDNPGVHPGEPPTGFDGGCCFRSPPIYPCVIMSEVGPSARHVPNRLLKNESDWQDFKAEFHARHCWLYEGMPNITAEMPATIKRNYEKALENKKRGDAAIASRRGRGAE